MRVRHFAALAAVGVLSLAVASSAGAADECDGLMVCVPIAGPWVAVSSSPARERSEWQLTCPKAYVVAGLDARLSERAIDVAFLGALGSPVSPGITTSRSALFSGAYVGTSKRGSTFKPFVGCMPASGGGGRVPTSVTVVKPGKPTARRVKTVRVRPGTTTVSQACAARERLVGATHAFGFETRTPPSASLISSVTGVQGTRGNRVVVRVRGDAELAGVRAVVQVHAVCAVTR